MVRSRLRRGSSQPKDRAAFRQLPTPWPADHTFDPGRERRITARTSPAANFARVATTPSTRSWLRAFSFRVVEDDADEKPSCLTPRLLPRLLLRFDRVERLETIGTVLQCATMTISTICERFNRIFPFFRPGEFPAFSFQPMDNCPHPF